MKSISGFGKRRALIALSLIIVVILASASLTNAQLSQWRSLNPFRDGTLPITLGNEPPFLHSVHLLSANYGWAVGGTCDMYPLRVGGVPSCPTYPGIGFALFYDGLKWRNVLVPAATGTLTAVSIVSTKDVWAVGLGPTIIHWDGIGWATVPPPAGLGDLFGLYMLLGGTDGWAVGDCPAGGATIGCDPGEVDNIRWSGTFPSGAWSPGPTGPLLGAGPLDETLRAVSLNSPTFGWIVASNGAIFKWDGGGWLVQVTPVVGVDLLSVYALSNTDAWAVGAASTIIRWNGASWTGPMVAPTVGLAYRSIKMVTATDGWIAGVLNPVTVEGLLLRWNGVAWSIVRSWITQDLNGLFMLPGGTTGSAVGDAETIIYWSNVQWISQTSPTAFPLFDLHMVSSTDGWAVGGPFPFGLGGPMGSSIFRWDGTHWFHYETLPSPNTLLGVFMLNTNDGWAVGNAAGPAAPPVILRWDGVAWTVKSPPGVALGGTLTDVHALSPTEAWAVGFTAASPPILKWDGTIWTSVPSGLPVGAILSDVHMLSSTDGWAVGCDAAGGLACTGPAILRWNGLAWSAVTPPPGIAGLLDVYMLSPIDGWAVGNIAGDGQGTIIHWDGTQWRRVPGPTAGFLTSVHMVSPTDGWTVGWDVATALSLIVHWNGLTWDVVSTPPVPTTMNNILTSVFMVSSLDGWVVSGFSFVAGFGAGTGLFLHYGPEIACVPTTVTATSTTSVTQTSTVTTTSAATTTSTTTVSGGPIPGFPIESIVVGLAGGVLALTIIRRRRSRL